MNLTGELGIRVRLVALNQDESRIDDLQVMLYRPVVSRLFVAQPAKTVRQLVPYLYTLCARAQCAASQAALAAAGARDLPPPEDDHRLWLEMLHEGFWRLLLDWPSALGLPQARDDFIDWRTRQRNRETDIAASTQLLSQTLEPLAERCMAALAVQWPDSRKTLAADAATPACLAASRLTPADWLPYWQGTSQKLPSAFVPASVAVAWCQRLAMTRYAVQALVEGWPFPLATAHDDCGLAVGQVWTARGVLTHAVERMDVRMSGTGDNDVVRRYAVWSPTDRHFANADALLCLSGSRTLPAAPEQARRYLNQIILALDPCLPYTLELSHA